MVRNIIVIVGAVLTGIIVMQPFMMAVQYVTDGRVFEGVAGTLLLHLIVLVPSLAAAGAIGAVAACFVRTSRPAAWAVAIAGTVACLLLLSQRYVAPDWVAWLATISAIVVPSLLAWLLFKMVWRLRNCDVPVV